VKPWLPKPEEPVSVRGNGRVATQSNTKFTLLLQKTLMNLTFPKISFKKKPHLSLQATLFPALFGAAFPSLPLAAAPFLEQRLENIFALCV